MLDFENEARKNLERLVKATQLTRSDLDTAMLKPVIDAILPFMAIYENPLIAWLPAEFRAGRDSNFNQQTPGSTPSEFVAENGTPTKDANSYTLTTIAHKIQAGRGEVTRFAQETGENFSDLLMDELNGKMIGFWNEMEKQMIQGTVSSTAPAGLYTLLPSSQTVANSATVGGAFFDEMQFKYLLSKVKAKPASAGIILSDRVHLQMESIVLSDRRHMNEVEIVGGALMPAYQYIPIFESTNVLNTMTWSGTATSSLTGATASEIYVVNKNWCKRRYLREPSFFPLATTNSLLITFDIIAFWHMVVTNYLYCGRLGGILTTDLSE